MDNQASELFELCKKVYELTGWKGVGKAYVNAPLEPDKSHRIYTSDYLLEKLASDYSIEVTVKYVSHDTKNSLYRYMIDKLGKFVAFTPDMAMGKYPVGDKPVVPLLKLTIALSEEGELNG